MGFEDKTTYVYAFTADKTPTLLSHLVSSLAAHDYSIEDAEADRTATIEHEGTSYTLPIYAISKRFYSGDDDAQGYRSEKDLKFELKPRHPPSNSILAFGASQIACSTKTEQIDMQPKAKRTST